jgi:hypothetical protein
MSIVQYKAQISLQTQGLSLSLIAMTRPGAVVDYPWPTVERADRLVAEVVQPTQTASA